MDLPQWWKSEKPYKISDCLDIMADIPDESINLILTDPPYGISFKSARTQNHEKLINDDLEDWQDFLPLWLSEFKRILSPRGACLCFTSGGGARPISAIFTLEFVKYFHLLNTVIWDKGSGGLGWRYRPAYECVVVGTKNKIDYKWNGNGSTYNIVRFNNIIPNADNHPTEKPVELFKHFIRLHTDEGDVVFDPFLGSGTTIRACRELGRIGLGCEIEPKFEKLIIKKSLAKIKPVEKWFSDAEV